MEPCYCYCYWRALRRNCYCHVKTLVALLAVALRRNCYCWRVLAVLVLAVAALVLLVKYPSGYKGLQCREQSLEPKLLGVVLLSV